MLGWEFPPFISGGLGTACHGLTKALDHQGHEILFVLPKPVDRSHAEHVTLITPESEARYPNLVGALRAERSGADPGPDAEHPQPEGAPPLERTQFRTVQAGPDMGSPYPGEARDDRPLTARDVVLPIGVRPAARAPHGAADATVPAPADRPVQEAEAAAPGPAPAPAAPAPAPVESDYAGDVVAQTRRYADMVMALCAQDPFDVIHAHDWMTYPAGMALARATGKPLVTHIHSTEYDRSGENVDTRIADIERRGMAAAVRVVAVSYLTRSICVRRYAIDPAKVRVVYNGVDWTPGAAPSELTVRSKDKIVLYLGRITHQKGPEYFVAAAKRVLEKMDNVKFLVAGSGDMAHRMIALAAEMGIGHKVLFTGFLRGDDVKKAFRMADCYVMPSVSEPFGLAPLEAMGHDVPVIISKQSGVAEVLEHALKVDFWDIDEMANKIIAVLRHPPLGATLRQHGPFEMRRLTWESAATKTVRVYDEALQAMEGAAAYA